MKLPCLILVESNTTGTGRHFAASARKLGLEPLVVAINPAKYPYIKEDSIRTVIADTSDLTVLLQTCKQIEADFEIAGVTSCSESYVHAAAVLAANLGLPGPRADAISRCRDKQQQRHLLESSGVPIPPYRCVTTAKEAITAGQKFGFPVIAKPITGTGSIGVKLCRNESELWQHASRLLHQDKSERSIPISGKILIEAYIHGHEFSVETFGREVIGITRKHPGKQPFFVAIGHDFPCVLSESESRHIASTALRALEALGLGWGPAHIEITMAAQEAVIIEVNPRLAGALIPELVRLASGVDLITATVSLATSRDIHLEASDHKSASIGFMIPPRSGQVKEILGLDSARSVANVLEVTSYVRIGDEVLCQGDFRDKCGHLIAVGESITESRNAVEQGLNAISFIVKPAPSA